MSPFAHFLNDLRLKHQVRQVDLAELLGYEQSYISALELGLKNAPNGEFLAKLIRVLELSADEQARLHEAVAASERKLAIPADANRNLYYLMHGLRQQIDNLHPVQVELINTALSLKGSLVDPEPEQVRRIKRRRKPATEE